MPAGEGQTYDRLPRPLRPHLMHAAQIIASGQLGQLESFQGGFYAQEPAGMWRLSKALGGVGALMDLGIYPLNATRHITREEPADFTAIVSTRDHSGRFAEVEQSMEWTMKFPSGIIASCGCSYGEQGPAFLEIHGDRGVLEVNPAYFYDGVHFRGQGRSGPFEESATGRHPYEF